MRYPFATSNDAILVETVLVGPAGAVDALLSLDTGASQTLIAVKTLVLAGYGAQTTAQPVQILSASGTATAAIIEVDCLRALGQEAKNIPILAHTLPSNTKLDGLLGLDFFRGKELNIDFRAGLITLH